MPTSAARRKPVPPDGTAHQDRSFVYDGYGRLQNQITPEEGTVSYTYYADDLVNTVRNQKPSGNTATFTYNNRHQVNGISYNDAGATPSVSFGTYDEYGARSSVTASGVATTSYSYNSFHQLQSESVTLTGLGTYSLSYAYNYVGAPTSVTYTVGGWVKHVNYDFNYAGAMRGVGTDLLSGAASNNNTNVINTLAYRGFGGVKSLNFGKFHRTPKVDDSFHHKGSKGQRVKARIWFVFFVPLTLCDKKSLITNCHPEDETCRISARTRAWCNSATTPSASN